MEKIDLNNFSLKEKRKRSVNTSRERRESTICAEDV